jgi:predicted nucleic acid-binding protein
MKKLVEDAVPLLPGKEADVFSWSQTQRSTSQHIQLHRQRGFRCCAKRVAAFPERPDVTICISAITEAELRYGMAKRAVSAKHRQAIEGLLAHLEILPWGREEAAAYGDTRATLAARGHSVSEMNI